MRIPESELIINADGSAFHLHIKPENLADNVILVGDPGRVAMFEPYFSEIESRTSSREFVSITGVCNGTRFTVLSTGIGTDNIDIVMTELDALANIDFETREVKKEHRTLNIVRIGTTGALHADIPLGSFILSHMSVGFDGLLNWYDRRELIADIDMENAFVEFMSWDRHLPAPYFVKASEKLVALLEEGTVKGLTISSPGFYGPQGRCVRMGLAMPDMLDKIEAFRYGGYRITNFEMESSALAGLSLRLGHEATTVCCAIANRYLKSVNTDYQPRVKELIKFVLDRLSA